MARGPWHILKRNARSETAHNLIFFDTETKARKHADGSESDYLWFGWACALQRTSQGKWGKEKWKRFSRVGDLWRSLDGMVGTKRRWFIFCHNTSYDLPVIDIFGQAAKRGWKVDGAVIEAPPTIITLTRGGVTLTFLDTLNWWRMSLEKAGKHIGYEKLKMPDPKAPRAEWDTYCRQDVEVIKQLVCTWLDFLKVNDLGGFATTLAGQAFRTFRHRFMSHDVVIDNNEQSHLISREAYHGGRVECFRVGWQKGPVYGVDINSMYPACMLEGFFPIRLHGVYESERKERWEKLLDRYCIVARCSIDSPIPAYAVGSKTGLKFPIGRFEATLTTPEIAFALSRGHLRDMKDIVVYDKAPIFTEYVRFMWGKRQEAQAAKHSVNDWFFKHLGTNLYGKFGQTGMVYESSDWISDKTCKKFDIIDYHTRKVIKCRQLGGLLQTMSKEGEGRESFPAIAAHVTAYGRMMLWGLIDKAGLENLLYTDTDSLYLNAKGFQALQSEIDPKALGKLKVLGEWPWMVIHSLKDYELPGHRVHKGVSAKALQIGPNSFQQVQWSSLKGLVMIGDVTAPRRRKVIKKLARSYRSKRTLT